jgi:hypothetical protein
MRCEFFNGGRLLGILLLILVFDPLRCTVPATITDAAEFPPSIVITEGKTTQGFQYLSGGVGSDERAALDERGKAFNVKLAFAEQRGPYLADVNVMIVDAKGIEILSLASAGPWFYIHLPPGRYNVKATYGGQTKEIRNLQLAKDQAARHVLTWNLGSE